MKIINMNVLNIYVMIFIKNENILKNYKTIKVLY